MSSLRLTIDPAKIYHSARLDSRLKGTLHEREREKIDSARSMVIQ